MERICNIAEAGNVVKKRFTKRNSVNQFIQNGTRIFRDKGIIFLKDL